MTDRDLIDFGIWRRMDEDVTDEETKREALEASQGAIAELREKGIEVEWVRTDVLEDPDSDADCAYCHYRAPSEEAIKEHSERAGLPVTELTRMDDQLDRETIE
ncbi:DUF4242 domain-containing protein [Halostella sp. JP-L12]|uniref:nickel-binding protein n=1 Tax=Halostella TaxID=1843185 RepID=UPI000EF84326|nr:MULTISPECIES: nickel-binding protein [Halostella]NHN47930.1 DUF4242 domain-containing protein [Halostella sp. JP-L12]